jgi:hypothetical protein
LKTGKEFLVVSKMADMKKSKSFFQLWTLTEGTNYGTDVTIVLSTPKMKMTFYVHAVSFQIRARLKLLKL